MRSFLILALLFSLNAIAAETFPGIKSLKGSVFNVKESLQVENKAPVKKELATPISKKTRLRDSALLQIDKGAEILIQLNQYSKLQIFEDSVVEFPSIHWKQGVINEIRLRSGRLRYICEKACDIKVSTPLSENAFAIGDYVLNYDQKIPQVELSVISGEASFQGLENETSITLKEGERANFTGAYTEDHVISYDVLLRGKKVAQGKMSEVQKLTAAEINVYKKPVVEKPKKKSKAVLEQEKKEAARSAKQICSKPNGELNQCAWTCEHNSKSAKDCDYQKGAQCLRTRCNANGEWADKTVLPNSEAKCLNKTFVSACDY